MSETPRHSPSGTELVLELQDLPGALVPSQIEPGNVGEIIGTDTAGSVVWSSRRPTYFDTSDSPVGLWNFNNSLADLSGNGNTFSEITAGTTRYADIYPGMKALSVTNAVGANVRWETTVNPTPLRILGALTIEVLCNLIPTAADDILMFAGSGTGQANNVLYWAYKNTGDAKPGYAHAHGANVSDFFNADTEVPFNLCYMAWTRNSAGTVINHYQNGRLIGTSSALTPPDGGTSSNRLTLGRNQNTITGSVCPGMYASIRITAAQKSDSTILREYNKTLGPVYGLLT